MSLLSRLIFAFMTIVSLLIAVGLGSYLTQRRIEREVADLRPSRRVDLRGFDRTASHLEIEGVWNGSRFIAEDVAVGPGVRRPKLRGVIERVDPTRRFIQIFGTEVRVGSETAFLDAPDPARGFEELQPGQRVEVSAQVSQEGWKARKLRIRDVKASDQIKGTPSAVDAGGGVLQHATFDGIRVSVMPVSAPTPNGAIRQAELATELGSRLEELRAAAHAVLGVSPLWRGGDDEAEDRAARGAGQWLLEGVRAVEETLARAGRPGERCTHLVELARQVPELRSRARELRELAERNGMEARRFLGEDFEPFLQNRMLPLVYGHRREAEEALESQVRGISERARATTGLLLGASALATLLAVVLGVGTWRAIRGPLQALQAAAERVGRGHLETRVEEEGPRELLVLARAFNRMSADLSASTVSVAKLERVLDSMASLLVLTDAEGRITRVNRAVEGLLGYDPQALHGESFSRICPDFDAQGAGDSARDAIGAEQSFVRADGSTLCVSLSRAAIESPEGGAAGSVCVAQDLSDWKHAQEQLRASVREKELLLREVHHRVKNNMQVISSLIAIHASYLRDPEAIRRLQECQNQIQSMALIHEQLYTASQPSHVDLPLYLRTLGAHLAASFGSDSRVRLEVQADEVRIQLDQALACGLIVNELVTNALRHAFGSGRPGKIRVAFRAGPGGRCVLSVADDGCGWPAESEPRAGGMGLDLVRTLAAQLRGELRLGVRGGADASVVFTSEVAVA